jgi:hypothetical protein
MYNNQTQLWKTQTGQTYGWFNYEVAGNLYSPWQQDYWTTTLAMLVLHVLSFLSSHSRTTLTTFPGNPFGPRANVVGEELASLGSSSTRFYLLLS